MASATLHSRTSGSNQGLSPKCAGAAGSIRFSVTIQVPQRHSARFFCDTKLGRSQGMATIDRPYKSSPDP
jgi:hypothetical protein